MRQPIEIPLQSGQPQTFQVALSGATYTFRTYWNYYTENWMLDIGDASNNPLAQGVALITGVDVLSQLGYLGIKGQMLVVADNEPPFTVPRFNDFGSGHLGHLYFVPN